MRKDIPQETINELRDLIIKIETLHKVLKDQGIRPYVDPKDLLLRGNFFYEIGDYKKWLEYYDVIISEFPFSEECLTVGKNLRFVKENCIIDTKG